MTEIYDPELRKIVLSNYDGKAVLNEEFLDWDNFISEIILNRGKRFKEFRESNKEQLEKLKTACIQHEKRYSGNIDKENVLSLTHPLYLFFNDERGGMNKITSKQAKVYLDKLVNMLNKLPRNNTSVIMFEAPDHYAALTSLWLEQGFVDRVFFTEYQSGAVTNLKSLNVLKNKNVFVGGGYNEECLESTLGYTYNVIKDLKRLWAIDDLIIDTPNIWRRYNTIHCSDCITYGNTQGDQLLESNILSLETAMERLK